MCGCFVIGLGAFFPRIALALLWLFGDQVERAFDDNWLLPLLGLIFLPFTTLVYVLMFWWLGEVTGFTWFIVILAFLVDLGSYVGGVKTRPGTSQPA